MAINIPPMARKGLKFILRRASAHVFFCSSAFSTGLSSFAWQRNKRRGRELGMRISHKMDFPNYTPNSYNMSLRVNPQQKIIAVQSERNKSLSRELRDFSRIGF
jgi:hypothetical protein